MNKPKEIRKKKSENCRKMKQQSLKSELGKYRGLITFVFKVICW